MATTETDWEVICALNSLLKKFMESGNPDILEEVFSNFSELLKTSLQGKKFFPKTTFEEEEKKVLIETFARFCSCTFDKVNIDSFSQYDEHVNSNEEFLEHQFLEAKLPSAITRTFRPTSTENLPSDSEEDDEDFETEVDDDFETEVDDEGEPIVVPEIFFESAFKNELGQLFYTFKKILLNAFETVFFSKTAPIAIYNDLGFIDMYEHLRYSVHFRKDQDSDLMESYEYYIKNGRWNFNFALECVTDLVSEITQIDTFISSETDGAAIWNLLVSQLQHIQNVEERMTVVTLVAKNKVSRSSNREEMIDILASHHTSIVCFSPNLGITPYLLQPPGLFRKLISTDMKTKGSTDALYVLAKIGNCIADEKFEFTQSEIATEYRYRFSESLPQAVSRVRCCKFFNGKIIVEPATKFSLEKNPMELDSKGNFKIKPFVIRSCAVPIVWIK